MSARQIFPRSFGSYETEVRCLFLLRRVDGLASNAMQCQKEGSSTTDMFVSWLIQSLYFSLFMHQLIIGSDYSGEEVMNQNGKSQEGN